MTEISAEAVRVLRAKTDLPLMDCKRALTEANGDEAKAIEILRQQAGKLTIKRQDNATNEGRFRIAAKEDGSVVALVELMCESAPVAKSEDFLALADACAKQLLDGPGAANGDELLSQANPSNPGQLLKDLHLDVINKIREKIVIGRVLKVTGPAGGYVHHDGKTAVVFCATGSGNRVELLRDVAMHITALKPLFTLPGEVDSALSDKERARLTEETKASGKPENIIAKIVDGRMKTFYQEQGVLVEQAFAKDDSKSVGKALAEANYEAKSFIRWILGGK